MSTLFSPLAVRWSSLSRLQERVAVHANGVGLTVSRRGYAGLQKREAAALYCLMHDTTAVIVQVLHGAGATSAGTAAPVDLLEAEPELAGIDLDFVLDQLTTEGVLGMSSTGGADDRYWIS